MFQISKIKSSFAAMLTFGLSQVAFAQTAGVDPFTTALASVTEKTGTYAAALVGVAAIAIVFMIAIKYIKKLPASS